MRWGARRHVSWTGCFRSAPGRTGAWTTQGAPGVAEQGIPVNPRSELLTALKAADRRFSASLTVGHRRRWFFLKAQRRWPSFNHPTTFSEKVNWRILHDRREILGWTCDKLQMKEHARASGADVCVPDTLWTGRDVRELADLPLPERWVLKPSHRYGLVHFGGPGTDIEALVAATAGWLDDPQSEYLGEWAYSQAQAIFLVEEFIGQPGSPPPDDYKIMVFDGEPHLIQVDHSRYGGHRRSLFTPEWENIAVQYRVPDAGPMPRPDLLPEMLAAARLLGRAFDFIRIDLYLHDNRVFFGEYTPYPAGGLGRFSPRQLDVDLGALWRLPGSDSPGS